MATRLLLLSLFLPVAAGLSGCARQSLVESTDTDGDRKVTLPELSDALTREVFTASDTDKDGVISFAEWRKMAPNLDPSVWKYRDADGNGSVNMEEALAFTRRNKTWYPLFEGLDDDKDSVVTVEEAQQFIHDQQANSTTAR